ncbi:Por secretion system C-terminal sorting domain-containing protein [Polaribacter sp. KT25b]|uniref:CotH kinase family protein n=1 Tax=Polaribacter sp. KT25b TaxID=1855336 RepID=UPI00087AC308|nr:CotH kinase family protein [Polaribacter sp. KT25b]SDR96444.1 Por secretion system C-terminal sorting domain-containing protein [Polaribacter sp. KT25b]
MYQNYKIITITKKYVFLFFIFCIYNFSAQSVRINEVVSSNDAYLDEDGDTSDWLELHNFGTQQISLKDWYLSDDVNDLTKWIFPDITIAPNEYMLLWASSKNRTTVSVPRTLINKGDQFKYLIPSSEPSSNWKNLDFNDSSWATGVSGFGYNDGDDTTIIPVGTQSIYLRKAFTIDNLTKISSILLDIDYDDAFVAYINGTEIARANIVGTPPAYNSGTITDREAEIYSGGKPERFTVADFATILVEGENILTIQAHNISSSSSDFTIIPFLSAVFSTQSNLGITPPAILNLSENNKLHTNFKISSTSETLTLSNDSGTIVHQLTAENLAKNTSIGTSIISGEIVSYIDTTPGYENSRQEYVGSVQNEVLFSHQEGLLESAISLVLSGNFDNELILYTIDGSSPTENSLLYTDPIQISTNTTVRARLFLENYIPSDVATKTFVMNASSSTFTDSNLPIVIIATEDNVAIQDASRVFGTMKIIQRPNGARNYVSDANNEDFIDYSGTINIEIRGSSSQYLPKKPYGFSTLTADRFENDNVKLLGMPKENDWILNSFAFDDSMMRDYISYEMARRMGQYAVNLKYCEVIVNGEYMGLYALSEKIKIDGDRVDIAKLDIDDNTLPKLSGGYLLQTDRPTVEDPQAWYNNGAGYIIEKPNSEDVTTQQASYIENVFRSFDQNASNSSITDGYPSIIDVPSFVDYMIMAEVSSNADAYALSTFYHKDRSGKLRAGPVWDYNLTYGNDLFNTFDVYYDRSLTNVWQFQYSNTGSYIWRSLFYNTTFKCYLAKRFNEVTSTGASLDYNYIANLIDTTANLISEALVRENEKWNTINNFPSEVQNLKSWLQQRISWMKSNLGQFSNCSNITTPSLVISKINYHPQETTTFPESDDLEFIEIQNTGNTNVVLTGIYLLKLGVSYQFRKFSTLLAGKSIYLASNAATFEAKYGFAPFDTFTRNLPNSSHNLVLADAFGNVIDQVQYTDKAPWPETADGNGFYLELINPLSDNSLASNWKANTEDVLNTTFNLPTDIFTVYPNPANEKLTINASQTIEKIAIFNVLGQQIKTIKVNLQSTEIQIPALKKGMYVLSVQFIDGTRISTKFFKE